MATQNDGQKTPLRPARDDVLRDDDDDFDDDGEKKKVLLAHGCKRNAIEVGAVARETGDERGRRERRTDANDV